MFSLAIAISRPPSTGVGSASLTKPQSNAGIDEPGQRVAAVQREPPEAEVAEHLQDAEQHQRAPQAEPDHRARRRRSAPAIVSQRPITLLTTPTSAVL